MIITTQTPDIKTYGDIQEFKTSIKETDLEFIATLLSSNLYSNPESSFIREIVSNAWDSHVEAGTTNVPVIIKIDDRVTIRDYGTGLSPERFNEVYRNIGSSTKRETNDYIGGFGIGHLSTFACSNTTSIISYYNGTAYYYIGSKSNNTIVYHLVNTSPTEEKNGVEVAIDIDDREKYINALQHILFFPNVYVKIPYNLNKEDLFNSNKIKKHKYYSVSTIKTKYKLLLGNVLYPCTYNFEKEEKAFLDLINASGIVLNFNIGELPVTPNRENIIYSSEAIKTIKERIKLAKEELFNHINSSLPKVYNDIVEFYYYKRGFLYEPFDEIVTYKTYYNYYSNSIKMPIKLGNEEYLNIPYKVKEITDISKLNQILHISIPGIRGIYYNNKFMSRNYSRYYPSRNLKKANYIIIDKETKITQSIKDYIKLISTDNTVILSKFTLDEFKTIYKTKSFKANLDVESILILEAYYEHIINKAKYIDFKTDSKYIKFKSIHKTEKVKYKNIILREVKNNYTYKKTFDTIEDTIKYIKSLNKGVILTTLDTKYNYLSDIANFKNYVFLRAKKDIVDEILSRNLKCIVDLEWLTEKDPMLAKVNTANSVPLISGYLHIQLLKMCTKEDRDMFNELYRLQQVPFSYKQLSKGKGIDSYIEYISKKYDKYFKAYESCKEYLVGIINEDLLAGVIMKTKSFKINYEMYKRYKNHPLTKVLWQK